MKRRDRTARPRSRFVSIGTYLEANPQSDACRAPRIEREFERGVGRRSGRGARTEAWRERAEPFAPGPGRAVREGRMPGARVRPAPARGPGPAARAHDTLLQGAPRRSTTCSRWATSTAVSERSDIVFASLTILAIFTGTTLPEARGCFMRTSQRQTDASAS